MEASHMSKASLKPFQLHARILKEFGVCYDPKSLFTYEDVDWNFRLNLIDWLAERNVQLGYGNKTRKILKQFLERARRKKLASDMTPDQRHGFENYVKQVEEYEKKKKQMKKT